MKNIFRFLLHLPWFLAISMICHSAFADETGLASTEYAGLYDEIMHYRDMEKNIRDHLLFNARVLSEWEDLWLENIDIALVHGKIHIPVDVDQFGVLTLPLDPELKNEHARLVSNQPEGTLQFGLTISVRIPDAPRFEYSHLTRAVDQFNAVMRYKAGATATNPAVATGMTFVFQPGTLAVLSIVHRNGEFSAYADKDGHLNYVIDPGLADENPQVTVNQKPLIIFPWINN